MNINRSITVCSINCDLLLSSLHVWQTRVKLAKVRYMLLVALLKYMYDRVSQVCATIVGGQFSVFLVSFVVFTFNLSIIRLSSPSSII